jgi:hypothetical protein
MKIVLALLFSAAFGFADGVFFAGVGATPTPTPPPGFVAGDYGTVLAWYRAEDAAGADGASVTSLADHGPNGYGLTEATNPPTLKTAVINGHNVIRFDGVNDQLASTASTIGNTGTLIAVVGRITHTSANCFIKLFGLRGITWYPDATTLYADIGDAWGSGTPYRVNGVSTTAFPAFPAFAVVVISGIPTAVGTLLIGYPANDRFNGDFLEVVLYAGTLSNTNQDAAAAALMTKYGL